MGGFLSARERRGLDRTSPRGDQNGRYRPDDSIPTDDYRRRRRATRRRGCAPCTSRNAVESSVLTGDITPICPRDDCKSHLGIGKPVYAGEQTDTADADVRCLNEDCSFTACAQFVLVNLLDEEADSQTSLVHAGEIEPLEARYQQ